MTLLFQPAEVTTAYLKMALMGFQGSGKTFTGTETAIGLVKLMREMRLAAAEKPMFFLDTEKGSDWIKPRVEKAGIKLHTAKTRAFSDLLTAVPEAEANASILLVDSLDRPVRKAKEAALMAQRYKYAAASTALDRVIEECIRRGLVVQS